MKSTKLKPSKKTAKPTFVAILGGEGSGKSSMMELLHRSFPGKFVGTREPGGTPHAERIRRALFDKKHGKNSTPDTQFHLAWAARFAHVAKLIEPSLKAGRLVITDRFDGCTFAYQVWAGDRTLESIFWSTRKRLPRKPDLYIFFSVEVEEGLRRAALRKTGNNHFDQAKADFHHKVHAGYLRFLKNLPYEVINANQPLEKVKADFLALMEEIIN